MSKFFQYGGLYMNALEKVNELNARRSAIEAGGGEGAKKQGKAQFSARERINALLDEKSFVEIGAFVQHRATASMVDQYTPADGVIAGYGTVEGRLVYVYSQDATVLSGSVGEMHAKKISKIYDQALKMGAPVVGILDSAGLRIQEGMHGLDGYGDIYIRKTLASGVIPQISIIMGDCAGGAAFIPALSDFVFMSNQHGRMFMASPNTMKDQADKETAYDQFASGKIHSEKSGMVHFVLESEEICFDAVRELLSFIPSNNMEDAPLSGAADDLNRVAESLNTLIPSDDTKSFDMKDVISSIVDKGHLLEIHEKYAENIIIGFGRFNGYTVGIVANQPKEKDGVLDGWAGKKAAGFIHFCDAFNIPILSLTDVGEYRTSVVEEQQGMIKQTAKMVYAFANATVPKINILVRKAYGSGYVSMNSKHLGADVVYAWPTAQISVMNKEAAVEILYAEELRTAENPKELRAIRMQEYEMHQTSPYIAASMGYIDDIIEPSTTRKRIVAALEMLVSKRENRPSKKHGSTVV